MKALVLCNYRWGSGFDAVGYRKVGATPEGVEVPRCVVDPACLETIEQQLPGHKATVPTGADPKWRFFWRLGPRPAQTKFAELNAEPVIPQGGRLIIKCHH